MLLGKYTSRLNLEWIERREEFSINIFYYTFLPNIPATNTSWILFFAYHDKIREKDINKLPKTGLFS